MHWLQEYYFMYVGTLCDASKRIFFLSIVCIFQTILKKLLSSWRDCWGDHWQQYWEYWNKFLNIYFLYLQGPDDHHHGEIVEEIIDHDLEENIWNKNGKESKYLWIYFKHSLLDRGQWSPSYKVPAILKKSPQSWRDCWGNHWPWSWREYLK